MNTKTEFRIEYAPSKTVIWGLFGAFFSVIFFSVGVAPILFFEDLLISGDYTNFEQIAFLFLPALLWPLAYAMGALSIRHFLNGRSGSPLATFTKSGVKGYTPLGRPVVLRWKRSTLTLIPEGAGNIVMWDEDEIDSFAMKCIRLFLPVWNPKSVSIPLIYSVEKYDSVKTAFYDLNPYAAEKIGT